MRRMRKVSGVFLCLNIGVLQPDLGKEGGYHEA